MTDEELQALLDTASPGPWHLINRDAGVRSADMALIANAPALAAEVLALRAGAAASAERIKALEEGLSMLYDLFTHVKPSAFRNGVTDSTNTIDEGEVQAGLILDHAKALLKEPDEPTAEDAYGWGCQGWGDPR